MNNLNLMLLQETSRNEKKHEKKEKQLCIKKCRINREAII